MPLRTVNRLTWQTFLRSRSISLIAVLSTILTLMVPTYRAPIAFPLPAQLVLRLSRRKHFVKLTAKLPG